MMVKPKERVVRSVGASSTTAWLRHRCGTSVVPFGEALEGVYKATRGRNELIKERTATMPTRDASGQMMVKPKGRSCKEEAS